MTFAEIGFRLGMHLGIAVDLACRCLQHSGALPTRELQHVDGAKHAGLHRADRIFLVMTGRRRAGEAVDPVDIALDLDGIAYVMFDEAKIRMIEQRPDIADRSREQIVEADYRVAALQKRVAEVGSDEAGAAGDQHSR
ncbi:hypothetical protein ACVWW4_008551 [Bradyrhizobium sp. LB7.1]